MILSFFRPFPEFPVSVVVVIDCVLNKQPPSCSLLSELLQHGEQERESEQEGGDCKS